MSIIRTEGQNEEVESIDITNYEVFAAKLATPDGKPGGLGLVLRFKHGGVDEKDRKICLRFAEEKDFISTLAPMVEAAKEIWPRERDGETRARRIEELGEPAPVSLGRAARGLKDARTINADEMETIIVDDPERLRVALMSIPADAAPNALSAVVMREDQPPILLVFPGPGAAVGFGSSFCSAVDRLWPPKGPRPAPPPGTRGTSRHRRRRGR